MKKLSLIVGLTLWVAACSGTDAFENAPKGTDVTLEKQDGVRVEGRLVEVTPDNIVIDTRDGGRTTFARGEVKSLRTGVTKDVAAPGTADSPGRDPSRPDADRRDLEPSASATRAVEGAHEGSTDTRNPIGKLLDREPADREVTIPAGTALAVELRTPVGSDTSSVEDPVRAALRKPVLVEGVEALPAGTVVSGHVTNATRSGRVKGRASVGFRFTAVDPPGNEGRAAIQTATITRVAPATKKQDATKIGAGAVGGAIVGGILGGGDGAAKGAAIGGGAGTAVVMSTRGKEVRVHEGAPLTVKLTAPLTVRVPNR